MIRRAALALACLLAGTCAAAPAVTGRPATMSADARAADRSTATASSWPTSESHTLIA